MKDVFNFLEKRLVEVLTCPIFWVMSSEVTIHTTYVSLGGWSLLDSARFNRCIWMTKFLFLSFVTFTWPRAAGATAEFPKLTFLAQELNEINIIMKKIPANIFIVTDNKLLAFILI